MLSATEAGSYNSLNKGMFNPTPGTKALLDADKFATSGNRIQIYDFVDDGSTTVKHIDAYAGPDVDSNSPMHEYGTTWPFEDKATGQPTIYQWIPGTHKFFGWLETDNSANPALTATGLFGNNFASAFDAKNKILTIRLLDCLVVNHEIGSKKKEFSETTRFFASDLAFRFDYGKTSNAEPLSVRAKYMKFGDLMGLIRQMKERNQNTTSLEVELNQRIAFALSPIAFLLLGLPLAIRTSRRETSVGLFLSVILAGAFFLLIILCESFDKFPNIYPQYLLWLPNILFQCLGAYMTYRISKR
jgi:hypothetical protein